MFKLAIFDLDGTLLNTLTDLAVACNYALVQNGFPTHPVEAYKAFVGNGAARLITDILPENNRDAQTVARVRELFMQYYSEHAQDLTQPYDGISDLLQALYDAGIQVAVLSNKPHINTQILCDAYFKGFVQLAIGQREGFAIKPDPMGVYEIMRYFKAGAHETVYIGDSGVDMQTGKNAGLYTVGVSWGFRTKEELDENGADYIVNKTAQLLKKLVDK